MIDFLVIGGGIAGLSAGARLSALGRVHVLEAEDALGHHASGRSAALYEASYGKPAVQALNRASLEFHTAAGVLSPRGAMLVGRAAEAQAYQADLMGMTLSPISAQEACDLFPILNPKVVDRAAYDPAAQDIDTDKLMQHFARTIRQNGGQVETKRRVSMIARTARGWAVTAGEVFECRTLVNAAGAWVDEIAKLAGLEPLGFQPYRRSMARIPAPDGLSPATWPMVFGAGDGWYAKPDAGALIVSPSEEHPMAPHDAWADDMVLAEGLARYEAYVTEPVTRLLASWAGLRTFAPDRHLVLGPDPRDPGFIWCAGQGGYGFQSSPAASQLLFEVVSGVQTTLPAEIVRKLTPARLL